MNRWDQGLGIIGLLVLAIMLAMFLTIGIPVLLSPEPVKLSDWLGFAGSVFSGLVTIVAATIAWRAVQTQISSHREQVALDAMMREADRIESELPGIEICQLYMTRALAAVFHKQAEDAAEALKEKGLHLPDAEVRQVVYAEAGTDTPIHILETTAGCLMLLNKAATKAASLDAASARHTEAAESLWSVIRYVDKEVRIISNLVREMRKQARDYRQRIEKRVAAF